jgi:hypothetical protein
VLAAKSVGSSGIVPGHHPKSPHPKKSGGADFAAAAIAPPELQIRFGAARISVAATGPSHARANILSTFFLRFVAEQAEALGQSSRFGGGGRCANLTLVKW